MKVQFCSILAWSLNLLAIAQSHTTTVSFDYQVQRFLGDVSTMERNVYFNIHSGVTDDVDICRFMEDYDVGLGRSFWGPFSYSYNRTKEAGVFPSLKEDATTSQRPIVRCVATEHANATIIKQGVDVEKAGAWAAEYYSNKNASGASVPEFFEPMNEPFVHAGDKCFAPATSKEMKTLIADYYASIGRHIHEAQRLSKMKVIGYASAYPSMELNDFGHWNDNMKMFLDRAGQYMDGISIHLYDGINVRGSKSRRSGSNSEAILDLVESYCYLKFGKVFPFAITEYGGIDDSSSDVYNDIIDSRCVASVNHLLFNLLERQDNMLISIPFITGKAEWHLTAAYNYQPYGAVLFLPDTPTDVNNTQWHYSPKIHFYDLWKNVNGDRIEVQSDNLDIQVQAFRNGDRFYLAIDNLDDFAHTINLKSLSGWDQLSNFTLRSLHVDYDKGVIYSEKPFNPLSDALSIQKDETLVLVATLASEGFNNAVRRRKYYSSTYLQAITGNRTLEFSFAGVKAGVGRAVARVSIGRTLTASKTPKVAVNGVAVTMPDNWKGYDQSGREGFFGTLEIPFDMSLIREGNNEISLTFPDEGGRVASVVLQTEVYDETPNKFSTSLVNGNFESGKLEGWIPWVMDGELITVADDVKSGSYAARITGNAGIAQILAVKPNTNYEFQMYAKMKGSGNALVGVDSSEPVQVPESSDSYVPIAYKFNSGALSSVRFYADVKGVNSILWLDDVKLKNVDQ